MSPEQAALDSEKLDTRADIYSLGVLLCELLTGQLPRLGDAASRKLPLDRLLQCIREDDPKAPSLLAAGCTPEQATARNSSPAALSRQLRGDLDWIVFKALEKDPEKRYDSAAALAADVHGHLHSLPISAGRPSLRQSALKFYRRHRTASIAATAAAIALTAGLAVATYAFFKESRMRAQAVAQRQIADQQRLRAETQEQRAESELLRANAILDFLNALLEETGDQVRDGRNPEALRRALDIVCSQLQHYDHDPRLRATILTHTAHIYRTLGEENKAIPLLREQLRMEEDRHGLESEETLAALYDYSRALSLQGHHDEAIATAAETVARWKKLPQSERIERKTLMAQRDYADVLRRAGRLDEALAVFRSIDGNATEEVRHESSWITLVRYHAEALMEAHEFKQALAVLDKGLHLGDPAASDHAHRISLLHQVRSRVLFRQRKLEPAIIALEESLELDTLGESPRVHWDVVQRWVELSRLQALLNHLPEAIASCSEAVRLSEAIADTASLRGSLRPLAEHYSTATDYPQAAAAYQRLVQAEQGTSEPLSDEDFALCVMHQCLAGDLTDLPAQLSDLSSRIKQMNAVNSQAERKHLRLILCLCESIWNQHTGSELTQDWRFSIQQIATGSLHNLSTGALAKPLPRQPWINQAIPILRTALEQTPSSIIAERIPTQADLLAMERCLEERWAFEEPSSALFHLAAALRLLGQLDLAAQAYATIHTIPPQRHLNPGRPTLALIGQIECLESLGRTREAADLHRQLETLLQQPSDTPPPPSSLAWLQAHPRPTAVIAGDSSQNLSPQPPQQAVGAAPKAAP
ncbi:MAG: tetratricopeptide repeat protein [Verrucomicrobiales bacterium]|nr:tetratricopeptide repeat protein [Verrucomicrobiales bacterium]